MREHNYFISGVLNLTRCVLCNGFMITLSVNRGSTDSQTHRKPSPNVSFLFIAAVS